MKHTTGPALPDLTAEAIEQWITDTIDAKRVHYPSRDILEIYLLWEILKIMRQRTTPPTATDNANGGNQRGDGDSS